MTTLIPFLLLLASAAPASLDQVKAEPNLERRAREAIVFAAGSERNAETAYAKSDMESVKADLKDVEGAIVLARDSLTASRKTPGKDPALYKYAELHSRELLKRLGDLEERMDAGERDVLTGTKSKVQEIHDAWFDGIMEKKK